jgi:hypothetical protein
MKCLLAMKGYRGALTDPEDDNTTQAQGIMGMCVEDCHLTVVESADNAMEAWNALAALYQQQSSANVLRLKREMANLEKKREESITEFMSRVSNLREQIQTATGNAIQDADVICAILSALPSRYNMIKTVIETMPNLPSLSDVTAKLLMVEADQTKGNDIVNFNQSRPFGGARPQVYVPPHRRPGNSFKGRSDNQRSSWSKNKTSGARETRECYYCGKRGHLKRDCRKMKADNARQEGNTGGPTVVALFNKMTTTSDDNDYSQIDNDDAYTKGDYSDTRNGIKYYELIGEDNRRYTGKYPSYMIPVESLTTTRRTLSTHGSSIQVLAITSRATNTSFTTTAPCSRSIQSRTETTSP